MSVTIGTFDRVELSESQSESAEEVRAAFSILEKLIKLQVPAGRYQSLAITHLELSGLYSIKGISR
jgi:hypothetical protein